MQQIIGFLVCNNSRNGSSDIFSFVLWNGLSKKKKWLDGGRWECKLAADCKKAMGIQKYLKWMETRPESVVSPDQVMTF